MNYHDILDWFSHKINDLKDAALGAFLYFLYGHFYQNKNLYKGVSAFFIGTIFAIYLAPVFQGFTGIDIKPVSFLTGLLGMRLTEAVVDQDYKGFLKKVIQKLSLK